MAHDLGIIGRSGSISHPVLCGGQDPTMKEDFLKGCLLSLGSQGLLGRAATARLRSRQALEQARHHHWSMCKFRIAKSEKPKSETHGTSAGHRGCETAASRKVAVIDGSRSKTNNIYCIYIIYSNIIPSY